MLHKMLNIGTTPGFEKKKKKPLCLLIHNINLGDQRSVLHATLLSVTA